MFRHKTPKVKAVLLVAIGFSVVFCLVFLAGRSHAGGEIFPPQTGESSTMEVVPIQLTPNTCGFVLVDKTRQTLCLYEYRHHLPAHERLALVAARSYKYDVELQDYNTAEPRPETVKDLLQRALNVQKDPMAPVGTPETPTTGVPAPTPRP